MAFYFSTVSLIPRRLINYQLLTIFLPALRRPIQVLLGRWMVIIVCIMIDLTDTFLLSFVAEAERPIT